MRYRVKAYCKGSDYKENLKSAPVYLSLSAPKQREILINTGERIHPDFFDNKIGRCIGRSSEALEVQSSLDDQMVKLKLVIDDFSKDDDTPTLKMIKDRFLRKGNFNGFVGFARNELDIEKVRLSSITWKNYAHCLNNLEKYAPGLSFAEITVEFLEEYRSYLKNVGGRNEKGIYQDLATIRKFWNIALRKREVRHSPFDEFRIKTVRGSDQIKYLVLDELKNLLALYYEGDLSERLTGVLYYYLIGCLCGLRSKDLYELSLRQVKDKKTFEEILRRGEMEVYTSKSGYKKRVVIPVSSQLRQLLANPLKQSLVHKGDRRNKALREVLKIAQIEKYLSFHSSRHTFGVVSKQLGIDTAVVQDILGHDSISTTQIYARIVDDLRSKEMTKWDVI
ncbi:tyrosine-type recombinase/integrase [Reichenbachiella ulvae]|uniref:Site-specific integrase n=1 Tax=Reichenbachiella ulvae TaxID=2980104 RepID=A0ABT3CVI2_9BACT|nr:site-specific integrase [Reichenbachiella ulvae]MCV9387495.1 site-specific integrase [Reichenbachiella ulvae]